MFTDTQFMTARDKELVLKVWRTFLRHGLKRKHFTKRLYQHLHLHCGFIANFNLHGFYSTFFETGQDTERFFEQFCSYTTQNYGANSDYDDNQHRYAAGVQQVQPQDSEAGRRGHHPEA